jgi:hypothetical protein
MPLASLTVIEAEFILGGFEAGLDRPSEPGDAGEFGEAYLGRGKHNVKGTLAGVTLRRTRSQ